ncbi:MAG: HAMP domain-containing sensor histidine kinase [Acidobacteriota bacterium]
MRRTVVASILTAASVTVPCVAWYVVGSRDAARESERIEKEPKRQAWEASVRLAERLGARLEALRTAESQRPFYHYQNLYHDPKGAYEGASVIPSPLTQSPVDPLIRAHFQVDATGCLSLPTLNLELPSLNAPESFAAQRAILDELEPESRTLAMALGEARAEMRAAATGGEATLRSKTVSAALLAPVRPIPPKVEVLNQAAWTQNVQASRLYADIKSKKQSLDLPQADEDPSVEIGVADLQWRTVTLSGAPVLMALRRVTTPAGVLTQGFEISPPGVARLLEDSLLPARFVAGVPSGETQAPVPLAGASWRIAVDAPIEEAAARARAVQSSFRGTFVVGAILACLGGLVVVGLVFQAERLARERSRFAASAAHELRTPIAGLRMYGEMLADGLGNPEKAPDYARRVADEAERLGRVVTNILGFSRLERGTLTVSLTRGNLADAVATSISKLRPALEAAGATVDVAIGPEIPALSFDADGVHQIVQNLLDNAEKYTRGSADRGIRVALSAAGGGAELSVLDRGPGVPRASRHRIFDPFARADATEASGGLGLGLAMVRALAQAMNARVSYADREGGGSAFTVAFAG